MERIQAMRIAVCICTCNRPQLLDRLLRSLQAIELGDLQRSDVGIVVVDNASTGEAREACSKMAENLPVPLHFSEEHQRGISFARNRAVREALDWGAEWVAFIDDDDVPRSNWLLELLKRERETASDVVCGVWRWNLDRKTERWVKKTRMVRTYRIGKTKRGIPLRIGTGNSLISRRTLERLASQGPVFSPEFSAIGGGDTDFFIRASRNGAKIEVAEQSVIDRHFQDCRLSLWGMLRHGFRSGNASLYISRKHDSGTVVRRARVRALKRLILNFLLLPASLFSPALCGRSLYEIFHALGALHGCSGRRFEYYS